MDVVRAGWAVPEFRVVRPPRLPESFSGLLLISRTMTARLRCHVCCTCRLLRTRARDDQGESVLVPKGQPVDLRETGRRQPRSVT
jgi:hypothetical protein